MKVNITFIALNKSIKNNLAKSLADKLDMFYADVNDLIKYDITNIDKVISIAGIEYYNRVETKIVNSVSSYENTLITMELDTFFNNDNYKILKSTSLFIYVKIDFENYKKILDNEISENNKEEKSLNKKVFFERDKVLKSVSDIIVEYDENVDMIELLINSIKKYFKEVL